jgi:sensor domain DACNV-containing protein
MRNRSCYPRDLAIVVNDHLRRTKKRAIDIDALTRLFEVAYFASMIREEAELLNCKLIYINPDNPDPNPPRRIVSDRWSCVPLQQRIPLDVRSLVKLSKVATPWASALAVFRDAEGDLFIWGMIDQETHAYNYFNRESGSGAQRPGLIEVTIDDVGGISVYRGLSLVARLRQNALVTEFHDVFWDGPVHTTIQPYIHRFIEEVRAATGTEARWDRDHWPSSLADYWITSIIRILSNVQRYKHGGALLITTPEETPTDLTIKYGIDYDRLHQALIRRGKNAILSCEADDLIQSEYMDRRRRTMDVWAYLDKEVHGYELRDCEDEVTGCVRFISALSRVDGLLLANGFLTIKGFGVEITTRREPERIIVAGDALATQENLRAMSIDHYGMRHRSMMRYCFAHPDSIGFVISQDGDIRAMTMVGDELIMWDNVQVQLLVDYDG